MGICSIGPNTRRGRRGSYLRWDASSPTPPHPTPAPTRGHSHSPLIFGRTPSLDLIDEGIYGLSQVRPSFSMRSSASGGPQVPTGQGYGGSAGVSFPALLRQAPVLHVTLHP